MHYGSCRPQVHANVRLATHCGVNTWRSASAPCLVSRPNTDPRSCPAAPNLEHKPYKVPHAWWRGRRLHEELHPTHIPPGDPLSAHTLRSASTSCLVARPNRKVASGPLSCTLRASTESMLEPHSFSSTMLSACRTCMGRGDRNGRCNECTLQGEDGCSTAGQVDWICIGLVRGEEAPAKPCLSPRHRATSAHRDDVSPDGQLAHLLKHGPAAHIR
jgi:hypothetical protein